MGCASSKGGEKGEENASVKAEVSSSASPFEGNVSRSANGRTDANAGGKNQLRNDETRAVGAALAIGGVVVDAITGDAAAASSVLKVGRQVLETFEHVPFIAPVAYLLGAIVSACAEAECFKGDVAEFGVVIERVERVLCKASDIQGRRSVVEEIESVLEEALRCITKFKEKSFIRKIAVVGRTAEKLERLKRELSTLLNQLQLECTLDLDAIRRVKMEQCEQFKTRVEELGGAEAVINNESKIENVKNMMEYAERLTFAKLESIKSDTKKYVEGASQQMEALRKLEEHQKKHFEEVAREAELSRMKSENLERQVQELKEMLTSVKDAVKKMPTRHISEPSRISVMNQIGCVGMNKDAYAYDTLYKVCVEMFEALDGEVGLGFNMIDETRSHFPIWIMEPIEDGEDIEIFETPQKKLKYCVENDIWGCLRANVCQHVVHSQKSVTFTKYDDAPPLPTADELRILAEKGIDDYMLQRQIKQNEKGGVLSTDGKPSPYNTAMTEALKKPEKWFYHGEPLFFEGNTILGTLCMSNHTGFPNNFKNLQESGFFRDKINELSSALKVQGEQRWEAHIAQIQQLSASSATVPLANDWMYRAGMSALPPAGFTHPSYASGLSIEPYSMANQGPLSLNQMKYVRAPDT